jgi:hypothetical protein
MTQNGAVSPKMFLRIPIISAQTSRTDVNADILEEPILEKRILKIRGLFAAFDCPVELCIHESVREDLEWC